MCQNTHTWVIGHIAVENQMLFNLRRNAGCCGFLEMPVSVRLRTLVLNLECRDYAF